MTNFQKEFPHFDPATLPKLPNGFEDVSWRNDPCPCFFSEFLKLVIWVDFADPQLRVFPNAPRFTIYETDAVGVKVSGKQEFNTDDWAEVEKRVISHAATLL